MPVKAKIRLDYKAESGKRRFWWGQRDPRDAAKRSRTKMVSLLQNLPFQGLSVEVLNSDQEVYLVPDGETNQEIAYAPVELIVQADSLGDLMPLTLREEFRKIQVLEPKEMVLSHGDVERFIFKVSEEYRFELE